MKVFFQRKWPYCAAMCLSGGLYEWQWGRLDLSLEYLCLEAEGPRHRKHIRQAKLGPPPSFSLPLPLSFLRSFTPSLTFFFSAEGYIYTSCDVIGPVTRATPTRSLTNVIEKHISLTLGGSPLTRAQNPTFSTLMHPCF